MTTDPENEAQSPDDAAEANAMEQAQKNVAEERESNSGYQ